MIVVAGGEEISLGLGGYLDIGLLDTMEDLLVNFIGAVTFSIVGYFYVKNRGRGWFARNFIPRSSPRRRPPPTPTFRGNKSEKAGPYYLIHCEEV